MAIIYQHLKPNGKVFYIGIGVSKKRAYSKHNRSKYWLNIVSKYPYEVQILKQDLSWGEACELEKLLISWYGRKDLKTGCLVNMTDGGEGCSNCKLSEATLKKKSEVMKGKLAGIKNPMFGKKKDKHPAFGYRHTEQDKNKKKQNYIKENHHFYNKNLTESHKEKIKNSSIGRKVSKDTITKKIENHPSRKEGYTPPTLGMSLPKRLILDVEFGIFYNTVKEAANLYSIKVPTLTAMLNGRNKNKTTLIYC
jgi:hypothetical protein